MSDFVAGWDGGGTKTCVVCATADGTEIGRNVFGALNINGASEREIFSCVSQAVAFVQGMPGRCLGMVIATAGTSNPAAGEMVGRALLKAGYAGPYAMHGDQEAALFGAVDGVGAVLVAGTGSICYGRNAAGETARCGGYGYLVDDEGSGYAIGRDILSAVLRSADGRNAPTALSALVYAQEKWRDIPAIMRTLYTGETDKSQVASLAPLLRQAGGDPAADAIAKRAGGELARLCETVVRKLSMPDAQVALSGSILTHFESVRSETTQLLLKAFPGLRFCEPLHDAAYGAALMARLAYVR
jgi:N-acetylglucosamine kinase-like BadF-type ATPase